MPTAEDIIHQQELLTQHRHTLHHLLRQQAALGRDYAPPGIANGIIHVERSETSPRGFIDISVRSFAHAHDDSEEQ